MLPTLVIGATGKVGRAVVSQLTTDGIQVRATSRTIDPSEAPPCVEALASDLTRPESLDAVLDGVGSVLLIWTAPPIAAPAAIRRIARYAKRIVFLSAPIKTRHPFFQQPNPARRATEEIEHLIEASGVSWSYLRPHIFAANSLSWWAPQIRSTGAVRWPFLDVATAPIDERDIAAVAVRALLDTSNDPKDYVITGPQSLTQREQIETIARVTGQAIAAHEISPAEAKREWTHWPPAVSDMLLNAWRAASGVPAYVTNTVEQVTGSRARKFEQWVADNRRAFLRAG